MQRRRQIILVAMSLTLTGGHGGLGVAKEPSADAVPANVALASAGAVAIADSSYAGHVAGFVNDGKWIGPGDRPESNRWHGALEKPHPHWVWIRFRQPARIDAVAVHRADIVDYPVDMVGESSGDGGFTFHTLFTLTNLQMAPHEFTVRAGFAPVMADNFRLRILRSSHREYPNSAQLSEVEVFGTFASGAAKKPGRPSLQQPTAPLLKPGTADGMETVSRGEDVEFRSPWLRLACSRTEPRITALCWDSLGAGKVNENLLKGSATGGVRLNLDPLFPGPGQSGPPAGMDRPQMEVDGNVVRYTQRLPGGILARWEIRASARSFRLATALTAPERTLLREPPGVKFAFDVSTTPVAPLANPQPGRPTPLPCILHAADFGSLLVRSLSGGGRSGLTAEPVRAAGQWNALIHLPGSARSADGLFILPAGTSRWEAEFTVTGVAPLPSLTRQEPRLEALPRSWLNTFQYRPDIGILANNVVSDNAVFCMFTFTDPAVFTPQLPGRVEAIQLARESLDRYFTGAPGYGTGMEDILTDTYPSLLIAAWDVLRVTGDRHLLRRWLPTLERLAEKAVAQDRNGNGLPESTRSGLPGTAVCPTANWWDQVNFGHEDAYAAALSYRAFRCLADLERLARRQQQAARFEERAAKIQAAYVTNFFNPKTGVLAGWKDTGDRLHDYWFLSINGMAITYGLVPETLANAIVDRFEARLREVGYSRFDLGLPGNLAPIAKEDYGKATLGTPTKDDGSDSFGIFENGGASACYAYFYIQALYQLGRRAEAERILWPMMATFASGGFQNGVGHAGEWRRWDGQPSGYEGFLADAYYAQMAVFTGHYGIGFGPTGFRLEPWSPLKGRYVQLGLKFMGRMAGTVE